MAKPGGTWSLVLSSALYLGLCVGTVNAVGVVGEVAIGGELPNPPVVKIGLDPVDDGWQRMGPLVARPTRPTESFEIGAFRLPLAVNAYTGGMADWPAALVQAIGGASAARWTAVGLGALLLLLSHRFLLFHATETAAAAASLVLAADWSFVFYRKVLGGTEVLLQAASLLLLWALWSRRWRGGVHGTVAIALGVGLGLCAKLTFVATLLAVGIAALLTRWDRAPLLPPRAIHAGWLLIIPMICLSPLALAAVHHAGGPSIPSHDSLGLQWERLRSGLQGDHADREGAENLLYFLGNPLGFFHAAYGAPEQPPLSIFRLTGFSITLFGTYLGWRDSSRPSAALLRFLSLSVPLQIGLLFLMNHDLHHLAQATLLLALWCGVAAERVAEGFAPRGPLRTGGAAILVLPLVIPGILHLEGTDPVVEQIPVPTFTASGQAALVDLLRRNRVEQVVVADYECYGMLELQAPEIQVDPVWAAVAVHPSGKDVLRYSRGRYFLSVRPSMPMIYDWDPDPRSLMSTAAAAGVSAQPVDTLRILGKEGAWLWKIQ